MRSLKSDWLKFRRPIILGSTAAFLIIGSVAAVIVGLHELNRPRAHANIALYSQVDGVRSILYHSTDVFAILGIGFAAFSFANEFSSGTLRNLIVRQPHRLALFGGKAVVVGAILSVGVALAYAVALPAALISAPQYGVSTQLWTTSAGIGSILAGGGDLILSTLGYAVIGAVLGMTMRSPAAAIVVALAYVYGVEGLLTNAFASMSNVLFASQLDAIAHGGTVDVGYGSALLVAAAWAVGLSLLAGIDLRRRDVGV